jgi:methionine-rich copper-binding protein CopC
MILAGALTALGLQPALAHSPLQRATPADQAVISAETELLELTFKAPIRLTRVTLAQSGGATRDLDLSGAAAGFTTQYALPLGALSPGGYSVTWRGLSDDGHAMQGDLSFSVK